MAIPGEIVRINVRYSCPGYSDILNVFYGEVLGLVGDGVLLDAIEDWVTSDWGAAWIDLAADDMQLASFEADVLFGDGTVDRNLGGASIGIVGTEGNDVMPGAVSAYLLAYTQFPKSRGSKYVPGLGDADVVNGHITSGTLVKLAILLLRFLSFDGTALEEFLVAGILSRVAEEFREFSGGGTLTDVPAYQRRRKPNVGS